MSVIRPFSDVDLHAFVDDQVSPERRSMIAGYLKTAPAEAARVESWRRQNDAIRSVFSGAASEPVPLWLTIGQVASGKDRSAATGLERGLALPLPTAPAARPGWRRLGRMAGLTAALLTAFVAGVAAPALAPEMIGAVTAWVPVSPRLSELRSIGVRTLEAHQIYGLDPDHPAEMADSPTGALGAWFRRRLSFPVRIPDLKAEGWFLRGGRVVPGPQGAGALLVYEDALGDRLSLTVMRVSNPSLYDTSYDLLQGRVLAWMDGPLGFGVATSREGAWLADNARTLYRAVYQTSDG